MFLILLVLLPVLLLPPQSVLRTVRFGIVPSPIFLVLLLLAILLLALR